MSIRTATTPRELDMTRQLFRNYAEELNVDLCFQDFEAELQELPGPYASPQGTILLAYRSDTDAPEQAVGCVALQPLPDDGMCEMKRLYVVPEARGEGWGRTLAEAILTEARHRGYTRMRLDTLASLHAARALYRKLGFKEITAYYENPLSDVIYMETHL
ncbi:MAG: GNAT family N-acetyltransferase [Bacteroidota bacterium]